MGWISTPVAAQSRTRHDVDHAIWIEWSSSRLSGNRLTLWNAGGVAYLNGGGPGSNDLHHSGLSGSKPSSRVGSTVPRLIGALFARVQSRQGQHVVISTQESIAAISSWPSNTGLHGTGGVAPRPEADSALDFLECRDGWIFLCCVEESQWQTFVDLMGNPEWAGLELFANRIARAQNWDALKLLLQEWAQSQSVEEITRPDRRGAYRWRRFPPWPICSHPIT